MGYIILDRATSHITNNIITQYSNDSKFMSFIPSGLTHYLQPLDVVVNKPFKEGIKKLYVEYCLESGPEFMKISKNKIIDMVTKVWWDPNLITKDMIYNSFRCTGISNALNGKEDNLFSAWKKMEDEIL